MTQELAIARPLPPQRWGFLPTNQFWARAFLTPIALIYYLGLALYLPLLEHLGLGWWQIALALWLFHEVWGGLVERHARRHLARRGAHRLRSPVNPIGSDGASSAPELSACTSPRGASALVPAGEPRQPTAFTAEDWEVYYARVYGRLSGVVQVVFDLAFALLLFYPSWASKLLAVAWLVSSSMIAKTCTKRWKLNPGSAPDLGKP